MTESNALATVAGTRMLMTIDDMEAQVQDIQHLMRRVMRSGEHYGTIPGCGDKPTLLKPGAEKIALTFGFAPEYTIHEREFPGGHREYRVTCNLTHRQSGRAVGAGVGVCSTLESKYRYRAGGRSCPKCGSGAIIKGKAEYGGGWICFAKKGGCGAKFKDDDPQITSQTAGKVDNPDIADMYNTVLKMGKKRAFVDAVLTATAASDIFTQDIEDYEPRSTAGVGDADVIDVEATVVNDPPPTSRTKRQLQMSAVLAYARRCGVLFDDADADANTATIKALCVHCGTLDNAAKFADDMTNQGIYEWPATVEAQ